MWGLTSRVRALGRLISRLRLLLPDVSRRSWLWTVVPAVFCLSFILSIGPTLQYALTGLLSSDSPSIYGTAFDEGLVAWPSISDWLKYGLDPLFLAISATAFFASCYARRFSEMLVILVIAIFMCLTANDILISLFSNREDAPNLAASIVSNFFGSLSIAVLMAIFLVLYEKIAKISYAFSETFIKICASFFLILFGILTSCAFYYISYYFYQPLSADVLVTLKAPGAGSYLPSDERSLRSEHSEVRSFSPLPEKVAGGGATLTSPERSIPIAWKKLHSYPTYDATIQVYAGCGPQPNVADLPENGPKLHFKDVHVISAAFDSSGSSHLVIPKTKDNRFTFKDNQPNFFWIRRDKDQLSIQLFSAGNGVLRNSLSEASTFYLDAMLLGRVGDATHFRPRTFAFLSDGKPYIVSFGASKKLSASSRESCRSVSFSASPLDAPKNPKQINLYPETVDIGVLVRIVPRIQEPVDVLFPSYAETLVKGVDGWLEIEGLPIDQFNESALGVASMLQLTGGVETFTVDGKVFDAGPSCDIQAFGKFYGMYRADATLRFRGSAKAIWKDGKRLNSTKWERLTTEAQLAILGAIITFCLGFARIWRAIVSRLADQSKLAGLQ